MVSTDSPGNRFFFFSFLFHINMWAEKRVGACSRQRLQCLMVRHRCFSREEYLICLPNETSPSCRSIVQRFDPPGVASQSQTSTIVSFCTILKEKSFHRNVNTFYRVDQILKCGECRIFYSSFLRLSF